ncbi:hypothetical protein O6H91_12G023500 [Diphasiastrum complanatum]|uniref:Uncharacterized protein n=1 Tax=Diphasiastrum complanatum TaxID=34168 RepID=A0ACC2BZR4_DIPCM|nr:hypothetical protein O6H91_12G023500 [Diphasiastrum complanatum]
MGASTIMVPRYNAEKNDWKRVSSPNSPSPRSAHQAIAWKNWLFIFGGEFTSPNQERFHHYKDLWRFDLSSNVWEPLQVKGGPSPRSGHRMVLHKHKLILFGGFYDNLRDIRYFNDLYVLDLDEYKWTEIKPKPGAQWPSPRSGFQFASFLDEIFLYGGYFKDHVGDKDGLDKGVVHADMWTLDPRAWDWSKVKKLGMPPGPRAGFSMCVHKKRAVLFGGVVDTEDTGDLLNSTFLNEMYAFQMDNRRWYPLELRKAKVFKTKAKVQPAGEKARARSNGCSQIENAFDPDKVATSNTAENELNQKDLQELLAETTLDATASSIEDSSCMEGNSSKGSTVTENLSLTSPEDCILRPSGRINAAMAVGRDTLYLYGGLMEIGDQEVTLDDLYSLDLNKLDSWNCIVEATASDWVEVGEDDTEEEENDDDSSQTDGNSDTDEMEEGTSEVRNYTSTSTTLAAEKAAAIFRGDGKMSRKERKAKIDRLRAELGLADSQRTPLPGEALKDFFQRTNMYWQMAAYDHTQHTGKELRKDGFDLAESRYRELRPILDELARLEAEQKSEEDNGVHMPGPKCVNNKTRHPVSS